MQRRDFLKLLGATFFVKGLPFAISSEIVIVDIELAEGWEKILTFGKTTFNKETRQPEMMVEFNQTELWKYVELADSEGRVWTTPDQGKTWRCGLMSFSTRDDDENYQPAA